MAKRKTKLEKAKEEFLSFYYRTQTVIEETDVNAKILSDDTREKLIDIMVEVIMDSWDRSCYRDVIRSGWKGYSEQSDLNLIAEHIQYVEDVYEDVSECEQLTFDIKADCELYMANAIENAIGLK